MKKDSRLVSLEETGENTFELGEEIVLTEPVAEEPYIFPEIMKKLRGKRDRPTVAK